MNPWERSLGPLEKNAALRDDSRSSSTAGIQPQTIYNHGLRTLRQFSL